jgi:hypothetical protein
MEMLIAYLDLVPTAIFIWATIILLRDMYHMMGRTAVSLFAAGNAMVIVAGIYKCLWKILMYVKICDFAALNTSFFPMQSTGFLLAGIGILLMFRKGKNGVKLIAAAVPVYTSSLIFVIFQVMGLIVMRLGIVVLAKKMGRIASVVALLMSLAAMMVMGYLSAKDFSEPIYNLYAELVNTLGQTLYLVAACDMHRSGLADFQLEDKEQERIS